MNKISNIKEPIYFHKDYRNDLSHQNDKTKLLNKAQRVALVALPFISLYKPFGKTLAIGTSAARTFTCSVELLSSISDGDIYKVGKSFLNTTIAVSSIAGTILLHPIGMLITTGQDLALNGYHLFQAMTSGNKDKIIQETLQLANNIFYLLTMTNGSLEYKVLSLVCQVILGGHSSIKELKKGNYLEGFGHLAMCAIRVNQLTPHIQLLNTLYQYKNNPDGLPVLHYAVKKQNRGIVEYLIEICGEKVNQYEKTQDRTPLHFASETGNTSLMKYLLEKGASVTALDYRGHSVFHYAVNSNNPDTIRLLRKYTSDNKLLAYQKGGPFQQEWTPLVQACYLGKNEMVKACIEAGADVSVKHNGLFKLTALHYSAMACNADTVRLILSSGTSYEDLCSPHRLPVIYAAKYGNLEAMKYFFEIDSSSKLQKDRLVFEAMTQQTNQIFGKQGKLDCINHLMQLGYVSEDSVRDGVKTSFYEAIEFVINKGFLQVNKPHYGYSFLSFFAHEFTKEGIDICKLLIEKGADIHVLNDVGREPIHQAAASLNSYATTLIDLLLQKGADINTLDSSGMTPLDYAFAWNPKIYDYLVKLGAKRSGIKFYWE